MDNMISFEDFQAIQGIKQNAQTDDTPYIGIADGTINVNGDPNKTEIKPADYTVHFYFPANDMFKKRVATVGDKILWERDGYMYVERTYRGVYITPRRMSDAVTAGAVIESFLNEITEDGEIKALSYDQLKEVMMGNYSEFKETAYDLVATVLRISEAEAEWLDPTETLLVAFQIAMNNPALVNEADFFTPPSSKAEPMANGASEMK